MGAHGCLDIGVTGFGQHSDGYEYSTLNSRICSDDDRQLRYKRTET